MTLHNEYARVYLQFYGKYHNHKEQMAYAATTLYVAGMSALTARDLNEPFWESYSGLGLVVFLGLIVLSGLLVFLFVRWQLKNRRFAAGIVGAFMNLSARWLTQEPTPEDLALIRRGVDEQYYWPKAVVVELDGLQEEQDRGFRVPDGITYGVIWAWTALAVIGVSVSWININGCL